MMTFQQALDTHFAGAISTQSYFSRLQSGLYGHGFSRSRALLVVALCRDEITGRLQRELVSSWGNGFTLNALGGMLSGGVTSLRAAAAHAPVHGGRERLVLIAQTHIAMGPKGEMGHCMRKGRPDPSVACGALTAVASAMEAGSPPQADDPDDVEYAWLWRRLASRFEAGAKPDLLAITLAAHEAIVEDAERLLPLVIDHDRTDYVVATGINVHGPGDRQYVWPGVQYAMLSGERQAL